MKRNIYLIYLLTMLLTVLFAFMLSSRVAANKYTQFTESDVLQVEVVSELLNVRKGPGMEFDVISAISKGHIIDVLGEMNGWYVVHLPDDTIGVVANEFVKSYKIKTQPKENVAVFANVDYLSECNRLIALINDERKNTGLKPIILDKKVSEVAMKKADDMVKNDYFGHDSPIYGSPFSMLKQMGVSYKSAGENIAGNVSVENAHKQIMESLGHRANVLNPRYTKIGLGIVGSNEHGKIIVQLFIE